MGTGRTTVQERVLNLYIKHYVIKMESSKHIILGSGSPRRKEIMESLGFSFEVDNQNNFNEIYSADIPHEEIPALMSEGKSEGFHRPLDDNEILVTSDTMVLCGNRIMGKPRNSSEAADMLRFLSGKEHKVITSVTIRDNKNKETFTDTATVYFKELSDKEIEYYIRTCQPYDKAGAYAIQEWIGHIGITSINGSFYTIMGVPAHLVYEKLNKFLNLE